jgi:polyisoprenoid-binding protein YceI
MIMAGAVPAMAGPPSWNFDKAHSNFYFDIQHIFSVARGHFENYSGSMAFDPDNLEGGSVDIRVEVESINTNIKRRDEHLRSGDFFDSDKYPVMSFKSTSIRHLEGEKYEATGTLVIKDVRQEITIPFTFFGVKESPLQKGTLVAGFEAEFTIDRLAFNVGDGKFYKMGVVGKDVKITVSLELIRKK